MSTKGKFKQKEYNNIIQKDSNKKILTNNAKSYSLKKVTIEKNVKTCYNKKDRANSEKSAFQRKTYENKSKYNNKFIVMKQTLDKCNNSNQYKNIKVYKSFGGLDSSNENSLKIKQNQTNYLIHNHKYYDSKNSTIVKTDKTSNTIASKRSEQIKTHQSLNSFDSNKHVVETKIEYYGKPRYSSSSNSSRETNVSISKSQLKKIITDIWAKDIYCSNVESLSCFANDNQRNSYYLVENYEKELKKNINKIKEYETQIMKLKSALNIKEQEIKKLTQNLKHSENTIKIKNKQLYELNIKTNKKKVELDKDTHELQIISRKQENKVSNIFEKDGYSLQIISNKKGWNNNNVPSPVNEIFIETIKNESPIKVKKYEEIRNLINREKEEEIIKKQLEKINNFEIEEIGFLSIIAKKPNSNNICQHLQSILILSKAKKIPIIIQKIEEINITTFPIKVKYHIQELDGLEIINIKKKKLILQQQCLNGLEIKREYDMLLVKPKWDFLQIQGAGLKLIALKKEVELENQEIDEFKILGKEKPLNKIEKINNFKISGKVKMKPNYTINKERIRLIGLEKKEILNWNEINIPIKISKIFLKREHDKIEQKIEIDWNDIIKPIKTTKLIVSGLKTKKDKLKIVTKDKINYLYSSPVKDLDEYDIENFNINLIASEKKLDMSLRIYKCELNIKGKEKKKLSLIKNNIDSINLFGLMLKKNLIPLKVEQIYLKSKVDKNKDWSKIIKVMKTTDLNVLKKKKVQNKISKNIINIEIKTTKKIILKSIREIKLFIKSIGNIVNNPTYKTIKENRLYIKAIKNIEPKPEIILEKRKENKLFIKGFKKEKKEKPEWNKLNQLKKQNSLKLIGKDLKELKMKIMKNSNINIIAKTEKIIFKKQNLYSFTFQRIEQVEKNENEEFEIINNWSNILKAQRNTKFYIKGRIKNNKYVISKINKFMIKKEPEDEIIYNDDYNSIIQNKKDKVNEKNIKSQKDKILVIKEKEITPILRREIKSKRRFI